VSPKAELDINKNLKLGKKCQISSFVKMKSSDGMLQLGDRVDIAVGCFLGGSPAGLIIGDDCMIGPNCVILSSNYRTDNLEITFRKQGHKFSGTRIGNNVLIGANTVINDGTEIGDGVVIAANSFVSGKIAKNSIVQGNPAKIIFTRR
jgi:acetyltransferase-like isoleucine patch superfamily enzyme